MPSATRYAVLLTLPLLLCLPPPARSADDPAATVSPRARRLLSLLREGGTVRLVAFGDSLTAGWGTDGRHVYYRIAADALQYAFPQSRLEVVIHGHPGETTQGALERFEEEVVAARPDLLLVQFGGNDKGYGRRLGAFRQDLGELLRRAQEETEAVVVACLPPIVDPDPDNPWNAAARAVAAAQRVPAADLDRAIRTTDPDCRGPFPYGSHPGSFTHVVMGREVLRAVREALGLPQSLACRVRGGSTLSASRTCDVEVTAASLSDQPLTGTAQLQWQDEVREEPLRLAPRQRDLLPRSLPLPEFTGLAVSFPVRLLSRGDGLGNLEVRWLTLAPAVRADSVADTADPSALTWHPLSPQCFSFGRTLWRGPGDLSARFAVAVLPDRLRFLIEVADDDLSAATGSDPSQGDSAELYLDLRPDADQGKPVYSRQVVALQVSPPTAAGPSRWQPMQELPPELRALAVDCQATREGYRVQVDLPLSVLKATRGETWEGLGFDVGVNDADAGGQRKSQLMWTGYPDNYLNPGYLAGLYTREVPTGAVRQTLR